MSPSTKNLRERIEELVKNIGCNSCQGFADKKSEEAVHELLSSELSLAVKGLREAVEERMRPPKNWTCNCTEYRRDANECTCGAEYDQMKTSYDEALSSFDAKAKEILGESS